MYSQYLAHCSLPLTWEAFSLLGENTGSLLACLDHVSLDSYAQMTRCPSTFGLFSALHSLIICASCPFHVENDKIPKGALSNLARLSIHGCHSSLFEVLTHMEFVVVEVCILISDMFFLSLDSLDHLNTSQPEIIPFLRKHGPKLRTLMISGIHETKCTILDLCPNLTEIQIFQRADVRN